jgi:fluoride ion exporter CrcB/FEX
MQTHTYKLTRGGACTIRTLQDRTVRVADEQLSLQANLLWGVIYASFFGAICIVAAFWVNDFKGSPNLGMLVIAFVACPVIGFVVVVQAELKSRSTFRVWEIDPESVLVRYKDNQDYKRVGVQREELMLVSCTLQLPTFLGIRKLPAVLLAVESLPPETWLVVELMDEIPGTPLVGYEGVREQLIKAVGPIQEKSPDQPLILVGA